MQNIAITGAYGFLGTHLCAALEKRGYDIRDLYESRHRQSIGQYAPIAYKVASRYYNLTKDGDVDLMYKHLKSQQNDSLTIIHLAAAVGGIGINRQKPGTFYYENLIMGAMLMEQGRRAKVDKFVALGTICAYPKFTPIPFKEEDLWEGYPEETNAPYGIAKKAMLVQSQAYRQEFGFNSIFLLPVNMYGPGDNFKPESSHVIPALIKKCVDAREANLPEIICWGDGTPTREFLYVEDAAEAIILAAEKHNSSEPINIGTGLEISIKELVELVVKFTNYKGEVVWDNSYPNGQPRRCLDTTKATELLGFVAKTKFSDGLHKTIEWYEKARHDKRI